MYKMEVITYRVHITHDLRKGLDTERGLAQAELSIELDRLDGDRQIWRERRVAYKPSQDECFGWRFAIRCPWYKAIRLEGVHINDRDGEVETVVVLRRGGRRV